MDALSGYEKWIKAATGETVAVIVIFSLLVVILFGFGFSALVALYGFEKVMGTIFFIAFLLFLLIGWLRLMGQHWQG
jgi:protein-S-isoprenylcysteine O-methyltransferase Ste14